MARRALSWVSAVRDIKDDRAARSEVRSEPLKSFTRGVSLIAWRGRSGRRYVFSVHSIYDIDASDLSGMVVVGAATDGAIVNAFAHCTMADIDQMQDDGAKYIHLHSLADTAHERADVARDLRPLAMEAA